MHETEHAVSPVVGVMLMLVVTIIIAAVVSAFSGGLASDTKATPQASIDVKISTSGMQFKLLSGDPLPTKDLAIITYYTNSTGRTIRHEQTGTSNPTDVYGAMNYTEYCEWGYDSYCSIGNDVRSLVRVPYLSDMRYGYAGSYSARDNASWTTGSKNLHSDFGNFTWTPGDIMITGSAAGTADLLGINDQSTTTKHVITDPEFGSGSVVDVKILHVPSGRYLFDKEVVVS